MSDSQHSDLIACIFLVGACLAHGFAALLLSVLCLLQFGCALVERSKERKSARQGAGHVE